MINFNSREFKRYFRLSSVEIKNYFREIPPSRIKIKSDP